MIIWQSPLKNLNFTSKRLRGFFSCEGHGYQRQLCHHYQFFSFLVITLVLKYFMTLQHQLCVIIISSQPWESCQKLHWKFEKPPPLQRVISMIIVIIITIKITTKDLSGSVLIWPSPFSIPLKGNRPETRMFVVSVVTPLPFMAMTIFRLICYKTM